MAPYIKRLRIYPVKSLDPIEKEEVEIGIRSLKNDRAYAMLAEDGRFINGKRTGLVNTLKADYDLENNSITLGRRSEESRTRFELRENNAQLNAYLSDYFNMKVFLLHRTKGELMDIPGASSVTIISDASLISLQKDLQQKSLEDLRLRFRTNIELSGVEAYWEEQLFHSPGIGMRFRAGDVEMIGVSPRARCNVPPRDPLTGKTDKSFVKKMISSRDKNLPAKSKIPQYGSTYHLTVNTYLPETEFGKKIRVGDKIEIIESVNLQ